MLIVVRDVNLILFNHESEYSYKSVNLKFHLVSGYHHWGWNMWPAGCHRDCVARGSHCRRGEEGPILAQQCSPPVALPDN